MNETDWESESGMDARAGVHFAAQPTNGVASVGGGGIAGPQPAPSTDEMSRALNPKNLDSRSGPAVAPGPLRRSVPSHPVCPFCGTINETAIAPCRQCAMENTQATRAATRAKLGPWYVWQTRNPAAPGMNFATLMSLVERGRITPRSIVRGPTTHQLWRYAARVKGLSRHFGICWGCGAEVGKTAKVCLACKRLQQPPINPDILLEAGDQGPGPEAPAASSAQMAAQPTPTYASSFASPPASASSPPSQVLTRNAEAPPGFADASLPAGMVSELPLELYAPAGTGTARTRRFEPRAIPRGPIDPARLASLPIVDMGDEPLGSGMELAAFELPRNAAATRPGGRRVLKGVFIAFLLGAVSVGVTLYLNPNLSPQYAGWIHTAVDKIKGLFVSTGQSTLRTAPDGSAASSGAGEQNSGHIATRVAPAVAAPVPAVTTRLPGNPAGVMLVPAVPASVNVQFGPGAGVLKPPTDIPATGDRATVGGSGLSVVEKRAWDLRAAAIAAEQRADYANAVSNYEAIIKLALVEGTGPTDVHERLTRARTLLNNGER